MGPMRWVARVLGTFHVIKGKPTEKINKSKSTFTCSCLIDFPFENAQLVQVRDKYLNRLLGMEMNTQIFGITI